MAGQRRDRIGPRCTPLFELLGMPLHILVKGHNITIRDVFAGNTSRTLSQSSRVSEAPEKQLQLKQK
jgi:hypothetical protein